jgi:tetratricopeptide (TPR) repeat protein
MKYVFALVSLGALLFSSACTQSPEKLLATANKYHASKRYKEASILYQKVIAKDKTNAEAYYREALNLLDSHQPIQAIGFLRRAIDLKPDNTDAAVKLSEIYLAIYTSDPRKYKSMLNDVRDLSAKISAHAPKSFDAYRIDGLVALSEKDLDKALDDFQKANAIQPHSTELVGWYAETLLAKQRRDEAIALVEDMLAHNKGWGPGYDFLFLQYSRANNQAKAEQILRARLTNDPGTAAAYINMANYLVATNRYSEGESVIKRVLNDKKAFPTGRQLVGDFYVRARKYDQALDQYKQGLQEDPKQEVQYQTRIVAVYGLLGRKDEALKLAKEVAAKNPKNTIANEAYAALLLQRGTKSDLTSSVSELKNLVQRSPTNANLHLDLARAYYGLGNSDGALSESLEALRQNQKLQPARLLAARIYADRGDASKAIDQTENVLGAEPGNVEARLIHARALLRVGQTDNGQSELENLVASVPNLADARLLLGEIYIQRKDVDKAKEQFEKVWTSNPPDYRGYIGLQTIKLYQGQTQDAVQGMETLAEKNPKNDALRLQVANFKATAAGIDIKSNPERSKQFVTSAIGDLQAYLKESPKSDDAWNQLGVLQRSLAQNDAAMSSFNQAIALNSNNAQAWLNKAVLLDAMGKKKEAADGYNKVLGIDSQNTLAMNNLAFLNAQAKTNLDQAMTLATKAQRQAPNSPDISDTLGYVYYQKNLNTEALQIFRRVVQDNPDNPTFRYHLAMALLKQGDKRSARDEAEKAMKKAPPQQQSEIRSFVDQIG